MGVDLTGVEEVGEFTTAALVTESGTPQDAALRKWLSDKPAYLCEWMVTFTPVSAPEGKKRMRGWGAAEVSPACDGFKCCQGW